MCVLACCVCTVVHCQMNIGNNKVHIHVLKFFYYRLCMWVINKFYNDLFQAAVSALEQLPTVNAVIDGDDIIYRDYIDISIAVGTPKVCHCSVPSYLRENNLISCGWTGSNRLLYVIFCQIIW